MNETTLPAAKLSANTQVDLIDTVFAILGGEDSQGWIQEESAQSPSSCSKPWVLAIEDDDDSALTLKLQLAGHGIQVVRAAAGMDGYRMAFTEAPRAILLDYELPRGNGDYVLRRLKETSATADIPVIVLTGHKDITIERQMRAMGACDFFTKPVDWPRLLETLESQLVAVSN